MGATTNHLLLHSRLCDHVSNPLTGATSEELSPQAVRLHSRTATAINHPQISHILLIRHRSTDGIVHPTDNKPDETSLIQLRSLHPFTPRPRNLLFAVRTSVPPSAHHAKAV